jgi:hypothetical protein
MVLEAPLQAEMVVQMFITVTSPTLVFMEVHRVVLRLLLAVLVVTPLEHHMVQVLALVEAE